MSWLSSENGTEAEELEDTFHDDRLSAITYESDTDKKEKKKRSSKPPKSHNSPYLSSAKLHPKKAPVWRSLKGTGQMHSENPVAKVPRQLWLASLKQGTGLTQPLKSDTDIGQAWVNPGSSTPEYLKEALGMKKPKYSRSSSNGYIPGTPDFKEKEDMYDQILDLKKTIQAHKSDNDIMKTKLRRLEEENNRKDRQIEQLLDPSRSSEFTRSLVDKKSDSSLLVNNLKQKILKLEKQCKEKDNALSKLQTDLKTTSVDEMRIAIETYYEEIQRLQLLLAKAETQEKKTPPESKESLRRQKALNMALMKLSKQVKELQEENKSLKADLDRAMAQSPTSSRKGYNEWSKQRLVRRISELEKKLEIAEKTNPSTTQQDKLGRPDGSTSLDEVDHPKPDVQEESERLRNIIKKVKEDRADLQERLASKESDYKKLQQEKTELEKQLQKLKERKDKREEINRLNQKVKKLEAELEDERREKETTTEPVKRPQSVSSEARPSSARSTSSTQSSRGSSATSRGREKRQDAAQVIQKNWRQYKSRKEENSDNSDLEDTVFLQAALRGHLVRQKMLSPSPTKPPRSNILSHQESNTSDSKSIQDTSKEEEDPVTLLQSTFRAHLTRTQMLGQRPSSSEVKGRESPNRKSPRGNSPSSVSRKPSKQESRLSLASNSSEEVSEEDIEELSEEEDDRAIKRPASRTSLSRPSSSTRPSSNTRPSSSTRPPSTRPSSSTRPPSRRSPKPAEEVQSDDSDDIIVSPSRPTRRKDSDF
ncbi:IQ domain-containing protein E isoform X2 [Hyperolius riggenbachi]|uniref:IQ domain-containing protein E isoform X2 n=1 Tax=Hyperolius riggenbachi TaxID=752182 RepID=UPI0035A2DBA1